MKIGSVPFLWPSDCAVEKVKSKAVTFSDALFRLALVSINQSVNGTLACMHCSGGREMGVSGGLFDDDDDDNVAVVERKGRKERKRK